MKGAAAVGFLLAAALRAGAQADERRVEMREQAFRRSVVLDFADPLESSEANTNAWFSTAQLVGRGSELLRLRYDLDESPIARPVVATFQFYLSMSIQVVSHELAHVREGSRFGPFSTRFEFRSFDFEKNIIKHYHYSPTLEEELANMMSGVNQDEQNACALYRNVRADWTFDNAMTFLFAKWSHFANAGLATPQDDTFIYVESLNSGFLDKQSIDVTIRQDLTAALLSNVLSVHSWYSLSAIVRYVVEGKSGTQVPTFAVGQAKVLPPLVSYYLTPRGGFFNITTIVNPGEENWIELEVGTDADFMSGGRVRRRRLGVRYAVIPGTGADTARASISLAPFGFLDVGRRLRYEGLSGGVEAIIRLSEVVGVRLRVEYNANDVIENAVKGEDRGFNLVVGLKIGL